MFLSALAFLTGILTVQQFSVLPDIFVMLGLSILVCGLAFFRYWRPLFFIAGMLWAIIFASDRLLDRLPDPLEGQLIKVNGNIVGLPRYDDRKVRFDFAVSSPNESLPKKIRLSWYFPKQLVKAGQHWQFTVKLKKPHGQFNPNVFDYERWLFVNNLGATGYVKTSPAPQKVADTAWWKSISVIRQTIAEKLDDLPINSEYIGIIKALTIGDKHDLTPQQWAVFRQTGTVHLLAISGLHIGLISGLMYFITLNIGTRLLIISPQQLAAISAILVAFFYSALAGFSLPTQRSLLMLTIAMSAIAWQRNITSTNTLALALFGVLLFDPLSVLSAGFWLSFLAVMVIVYSLVGRLGKKSYWLSATNIHWVTALGLAPLLLYYFQQISIVSPLSNFFTVPVISFLVVPLCLLGVLLLFLSPILATQLFFVVDKIIHYLWLALTEMVGLPYATIHSALPSFYTIPLAMMGVFILLAPKGIPARWLGIVMFLPLSLVDRDKPDIGKMRFTLLDVGQGLAAIIETKNHTLLFDSGAKYSDRYNMGSAVIIPFLTSRGIKEIDTLMISHGDNDHIGGAESIIEHSGVKQILTSVPETMSQYTGVEQCRAKQSWVWDNVSFDILSPATDDLIGENNNSCVLRVSSKGGSILLTGDIEKSAERWLVQSETILKSDILIAPHHGSKTSSTRSFLEHVNPKIILIPAGYKNKFSFPHQDVINRYKELKIPWMNTANQGALRVHNKDNALVVESARAVQGKYWNIQVKSKSTEY